MHRIASPLLFLFLIVFSQTTARTTASTSNNEKHGICRQLIIGGTNVSVQDYHFLCMYTKNGIRICDGTLIAPTAVLTSAYCIVEFSSLAPSSSPTEVQFTITCPGEGENGSTKNYSSTNNAILHLNISHVTVHESYALSDPFQYDVAIIHLNHPIKLSSPAITGQRHTI